MRVTRHAVHVHRVTGNCYSFQVGQGNNIHQSDIHATVWRVNRYLRRLHLTKDLQCVRISKTKRKESTAGVYKAGFNPAASSAPLSLHLDRTFP